MEGPGKRRNNQHEYHGLNVIAHFRPWQDFISNERWCPVDPVLVLDVPNGTQAPDLVG